MNHSTRDSIERNERPALAADLDAMFPNNAGIERPMKPQKED
jgi:hypothetical protein